jgi:kynurenine formamidase
MRENNGVGWVSLACPIFPEMVHSASHGDVQVWAEAEAGGLAQVTHVNTALHIGTHIDSENHFIEGGRGIEEYPLDRFIGTATVLDLRREGPVPVTREELEASNHDVRAGDIVLICFGYGKKTDQGSAYFEHPYLTQDAAQWFVDRGARTVGIDVLSPDLPAVVRPPEFTYPTHLTLMRNDVLIIEGLSAALEDLLGQRGDYIGVPVPVRGADGVPLVPLFRKH